MSPFFPFFFTDYTDWGWLRFGGVLASVGDLVARFLRVLVGQFFRQVVEFFGGSGFLRQSKKQNVPFSFQIRGD